MDFPRQKQKFLDTLIIWAFPQEGQSDILVGTLVFVAYQLNLDRLLYQIYLWAESKTCLLQSTPKRLVHLTQLQ